MASALTDYVFYWSDQELKPYFIVQQQTLNNTASTLSLFGKCYPNYGEPLQQNLLYMLEHFASPYPPNNPTIGQIWYNVSTNQLLIYDVFSLWTTITSIPTSIPLHPSLGELYWDTFNSTLNYWDGVAWQPIADHQFVMNLFDSLQNQSTTALQGITSQLNGEISAREFQYSQLLNDIASAEQLSANNDANLQQLIQNEASTRTSEIANVTGTISQLASTLQSDNSASILGLQAEINNRIDADQNLQNQLSNEINIRSQEVATITSSYALLSGANFSGPVMLNSNPVHPMQAATKEYIDTQMYNFTPNVVPYDVINSYAQIEIGPGNWVVYATATYSFNNEWYGWYGNYYGYDYWWANDYWGGSWWWGNNWWWNNWWWSSYGYTNIHCVLYVNGATLDSSVHVNYGNTGSTNDVHLNGTITLAGPATVTISSLINGYNNNNFHITGMAMRI
jgi:hypothetical protein